MLCIIVPNRRTASPEFFSWVRTRRLLSRHSCPVRSPSFPNQKRRNYRWVEKRFGCYQQEQFNLHWENSVSDGSQCIVNKWWSGYEKVKKAIAWHGKTTTLHVDQAFLYNERKWEKGTSLLSLIFASSWETSASRENLDMVDRNSAQEEFACIWQSKWVGIITIETEKMWVHSSCDVSWLSAVVTYKTP